MSEDPRTRELLVDDHPLVRDSLQRVLENSGEFEVVGQAADGNAAIQMAGDLRPDAVVMDVIMPGMDGVTACREITRLLPDARVLMLTSSTEDDSVIAAVAAGATGYVVKDAGLEDLLKAVRDVAMGRVRIPLPVLRRAAAVADGQSKPVLKGNQQLLTEREREVLTMFASGSSYADIAEAQGNSPSTVRNTVYRIQDKLGVGSRQGLVVWAVRNGLLDRE
ncbi:MAG: response regulator transcription factor [Chloroflexi bacterium]|nr:response regulator transcription factor [Chloroflexota bacterium]